MKKRLIKFVTLILSAIMALAGFSGCNLVTSNTERDLNQVVATVNINSEDNIYKKDLIMAYLNYGYYYVQYYGYSAADTYNLILNNLIDNRIVVQVAFDTFKNDDNYVKNAKYEQSDIKWYLSDEDITDAKYSTYKSINDLIDSYVEKADEKQDTLTMDLRTVPTNAKNAEKELTKAEKDAYIEKGFDTVSEDRRVAFNKVIKLLEANELKGKDYDGTISSTDYFNLLLKSNFESKIVENYEEYIVKGVKDKLEFSDLETLFKEKLTGQQGWSNEKFVSALSSASATEPILYSNQNGTYGYVYNLLLGVNDYQSKKIEELQHEKEHEHLNEAEYATERKAILEGTVAQDLRSSWVLSGYDGIFEKANEDDEYGKYTFTGDYKFTKDGLAFQGEVKQLRAKTDDKDGVYSIGSVETFGLDEFINFINTDYLYKGISLNPIDLSAYDKLNSNDIYKAYKPVAKPEEYDAKINELLFAFSTDSGSLNTYKGYVIKPENTEYVKTFGEAGKALLEEGGSSYMVVASDYGYHFMFFSEVWHYQDGYINEQGEPDLGLYLDSLGIDKGTLTWADYFNNQMEDWDEFAEDNSYLYVLASELISDELSDVSSQSSESIKIKYRYGEKKDSTVIYKERFADLLG